jgi:hypothetical protein
MELSEELREIGLRLIEIADELDGSHLKIKEKKTKEKKNKRIKNKEDKKEYNKSKNNFSYSREKTDELMEPDTESAEEFFKDLEVQNSSSCNSKVQQILAKNRGVKTKKGKSQTEVYEEKLEEERFSEFNCQDLVRYFRDCAEEAEIKFICNWGKDCKQMKSLLDKGITPEEAVLMINFLFLSDQTYLDKRMLGTTILNSGWANKIYYDSKDWVKGKYKDVLQKSKSGKKRQSDWEENEVSLGKLGGD